MTVGEIYSFIDDFAPFSSQLDFDNSGIIIGSGASEFHKIGVCLDITDDTFEYAKNSGIDLIICHHPPIWGGVSRISDSDTVYKLINSGICVIAAHTNLDAAAGGVCETLCSLIGVRHLSNAYLDEYPTVPIARIGEIAKALHPDDFAALLKLRLNTPDIRYIGSHTVKKIGVFNGSGGDLIDFAYKHGADSVVTSDIKHHQWLYAAKQGINLFDAGHFHTENVIVPVLAAKINEHFGEIAQIIPQSSPYKAV